MAVKVIQTSVKLRGLELEVEQLVYEEYDTKEDKVPAIFLENQPITVGV